MSTNFYIDGFNLYYGSLKTRYPQYRWLDIQALCENLVPNQRVNRVHYFTALLSNTANDDLVELRQQTHLRALATLPKVEIHYGKFETRRRRMPLWEPVRNVNAPQMVWVSHTEEKRSDVNLATYLLIDACYDDFDEAVVISNDSDLVEPITAVRDRFHKRIGVVNPNVAHRRSPDLQNAGSWAFPTIYKRYLRDNQLPDLVVDGDGAFGKPPRWQRR